MKNSKKWISVLLAAMLLVSTVVASGISVSAAGTLTSYYKTNPNNSFGKEKTITVDGDISDWDSSMLIAQGTANDDPRVYRPNSMYEVGQDMYALYGAFDSSNLYLMWEMTNVQDVVAPDDNYPLTQGTMYLNMNIPFFIAIDTGKSDAIGNSGKTTAGGTIWDSGITISKSFNRLIAISTNGANGPYIYGGSSAGLNAVELYKPATAGIVFKPGMGIVSKNVYGINGGYGANNNRVPGDMCSDASAWVDFNTKGHNSATMDYHYEMSIPLEKLGVTKSDVASNGLGVLAIITSGKSGMDCLPYDLAMNDNADLDDSAGSQENNSYEKSDPDNITTAFARIGAQGSDPVVTDPPVTTPPVTDPPVTEPDVPSSVLTINAKSNFFNSSTLTDLAVGDSVTVKYDLNSNIGVASAQWNLAYDSSKLRLVNVDAPANSVLNTTGNPVYGNFSNVSTLYDFNGGKNFVSAEFEVLKTGSTNVNLTVEELNLAIKSGSNLSVASIVENGQIKSVTGQAGFSSASVTGSSDVTKNGDVTNTLTVNATSNFFDSASVTFDEGTQRISVAYKLQSSEKLIDSEWQMTYDPGKLTFEGVSMPKVTAPVFGAPQNGVKTGNFSNLSLVDFSTKSDFVVATFSVKGTGTTTVNLNVINLGVAKISGSAANIAYVVDDGVVKNIKTQSGFSNYSYSTQTVISEVGNFVRGDVDKDGKVSISDATLLQRYFAEYTQLASDQLLRADANADGKVDIRDVTAIQRALANKEAIPA